MPRKARPYKLKNNAEDPVDVSQRKLATIFKVSQQLQQILSKCGKLRREIIDRETFVIIDDEKYFTFSGDGYA